MLMVLGFFFNGEPYQLQEMGIPFAIPKRGLDINLLVRKETTS